MGRRNPKPFTLCAHCRRSRGDRPRGLCATHYYDPAVRQLYPAMPAQASGSIGGHTPRRRITKEAA